MGKRKGDGNRKSRERNKEKRMGRQGGHVDGKMKNRERGRRRGENKVMGDRWENGKEGRSPPYSFVKVGAYASNSMDLNVTDGDCRNKC